MDRLFRDKDLEELTRKTYDIMGLEVRDVLARSDLYEREGKNQHGFCLAVGRDYPYDVRVLVNVRPDSYWMDTMLHEFGHAVYDKYINPKLPYFLRTVAHTCTTEAIALMMGSLVDDPAWLSAVVGVPVAELDEVREHLLWGERADRLVFTRWALVMFNFEQVFYADPDREAKAWLEKLSDVSNKRAAFQDMAAEGLISFDELRAKLAALEETREIAERELAALKGQSESLEQMERDKDAVLEHYVTLAPEALDSLVPEERRKLYNMLRLRVFAYPDEAPEVEWEWELPDPIICRMGTMETPSFKSPRRRPGSTWTASSGTWTSRS